jgi:ribonuclease HI
MAEAAALALAAAVIKALQLDHTTMLSDNQQLVHFLNGQDQEHPPDWRVKPFTQLIKTSLQGIASSIKRIRRTQNQMADLLARQALTCIRANQITFNGDCSFAPHEQECPLMTALHNVTVNSVMVLTASCC